MSICTSCHSDLIIQAHAPDCPNDRHIKERTEALTKARADLFTKAAAAGYGRADGDLAPTEVVFGKGPLPEAAFGVGPGTLILPEVQKANANWRTDGAARKGRPIATGVLDYFPDALAEVAYASKVGNDKHNPGEPLHWDKSKSTDEADCLIRHFVERGAIDADGVRHSAKVAWRALALLQRELEAAREELPVATDDAWFAKHSGTLKDGY